MFPPGLTPPETGLCLITAEAAAFKVRQEQHAGSERAGENRRQRPRWSQRPVPRSRGGGLSRGGGAGFGWSSRSGTRVPLPAPACACSHRCPGEKPPLALRGSSLCPAGPGWELGQTAAPSATASPCRPRVPPHTRSGCPGAPRNPPSNRAAYRSGGSPGRHRHAWPDPAGKGHARSGGYERRRLPATGRAQAEHPPAGGRHPPGVPWLPGHRPHPTAGPGRGFPLATVGGRARRGRPRDPGLQHPGRAAGTPSARHRPPPRRRPEAGPAPTASPAAPSAPPAGKQGARPARLPRGDPS